MMKHIHIVLYVIEYIVFFSTFLLLKKAVPDVIDIFCISIVAYLLYENINAYRSGVDDAFKLVIKEFEKLKESEKIGKKEEKELIDESKEDNSEEKDGWQS